MKIANEEIWTFFSHSKNKSFLLKTIHIQTDKLKLNFLCFKISQRRL
jgi:hypothetical protein